MNQRCGLASLLCVRTFKVCIVKNTAVADTGQHIVQVKESGYRQLSTRYEYITKYPVLYYSNRKVVGGLMAMNDSSAYTSPLKRPTREIVYSLVVWCGTVFPSSFLPSCTHASGDKSTRFMMVGNKDNSSTGAKTGVVAPVPINTPSLRQEIHGSLGDNAAIASINRASAGGGWGSAAGAASASAGNPDEAGGGGKGRGRGGGGARSQGGDDVFTRHFPDLRAGLEQAERLDAVTKASSKVAPLRKPKPEPTKDQGPSLRPRGAFETMLCMEKFSYVLYIMFLSPSRCLPLPVLRLNECARVGHSRLDLFTPRRQLIFLCYGVFFCIHCLLAQPC